MTVGQVTLKKVVFNAVAKTVELHRGEGVVLGIKAAKLSFHSCLALDRSLH